jgi:polysaccharide biosynthesis/export protein
MALQQQLRYLYSLATNYKKDSMAGLSSVPGRPRGCPREKLGSGRAPAKLRGLVMALTALAAFGLAQAQEYTVKAGDVLGVAVWKEPDLTSNSVLVRPDGTFSVPLVGQVDARGKGVLELQALITERLRKYISDPVVTVSVQDIKGNKVYVIGQVTKPGEFIVNPSVNVMQALSMAGGTTAFASLNNIIVLRRGAAGQAALPFHYNDVVHGKDLQQNVELQAGDVVVVP